MKHYLNLCSKSINNETWSNIKHSNYYVSDLGRIKKPDNSIQKQYSFKGYLYAPIYIMGVRKIARVHILVAQAFVPNPESKPTVNHKKGNKKDNRAIKLEWNTYSENMKHAYDLGLKKPTNGRRVVIMDKNNNPLHTADSAHEAARFVCGHQPVIYMCCIGTRRTHKGFKFKFAS